MAVKIFGFIKKNLRVKIAAQVKMPLRAVEEFFMSKSIVADKSKKFAIRIINLYKFLQEEMHEFIMSKQILRCGTSIGANLAESVFAQSDADFIHKLSIALKEASETKYWLELLVESEYVSTEKVQDLENECVGIIKMISSSIKTLKEKQND